MKKYVLAGAGCRAYGMFVLNIRNYFSDTIAITGVFDTNSVRAQFFKNDIGEGCTVYDDYEKMLDTEKPDGVLIATVDNTHHEYIVRALDKGYDVISEKPLTNTYERCLEIREAEKRSGHKVLVTFNCRFMPYFIEVKKLLMEGKIGKPLAVNYEYCLSRWHGGDYFKRWHRLMEFSQGMLLHKSTHHFDIANWLIDDEPAKVTALANQIYYSDTSKALGERCRDCPAADKCESNHGVADIDKELFFGKAESEDGYLKDRCCFKGDSDIYDNMSVSVMYTKGTILTYTLNLFSQHEGYRMVITGEKGVLIANSWDWGYGESSKEEIVILDKCGRVETIHFDKAGGMHNGGDKKLVDMLFNGVKEDPYGLFADSYAGFASAMIGVAANESIATGKTVDVQEYLKTLR